MPISLEKRTKKFSGRRYFLARALRAETESHLSAKNKNGVLCVNARVPALCDMQPPASA